MENKIDCKAYIEIYEKISELSSIKKLIKDNIKINEDGKLETKLFFAEDLVKLIKYIDIEFYKELQQGVDK